MNEENNQTAPQQPSTIEALTAEMQRIRRALGLTEDSDGSGLMQRLSLIEGKFSQAEKPNTPITITRQQAASRKFLLENNISLEDFKLGRVIVDFNKSEEG